MAEAAVIKEMGKAEDSTSYSSRPEDERSVVSSKSNDVRDVEATKEQVTPQTHDLASDDPNAVDWDGPDDPNKPLNWTPKKKWLNILVIAIMSLLT
jgi:DHA1 family multidrug resistance protein-like MFS transporter